MGRALNKRRGWICIFLRVFYWNTRILAVNAIVSWLIKLAAYFCQSLLITSQVYCPMIKVEWLTAGVLLWELAHCLQILLANEKLGLEADEISETLLTNRMQRKLYRTTKQWRSPEIICQDSLAGWWCTADLGFHHWAVTSTSRCTAGQILNSLQFANLTPTWY
jgi:hypothetical protein